MIIGHKKQWDFLEDKFTTNQLSHAYVFSGVEQLGKKFLAKEFVRLISCQYYESDGRQFCSMSKNAQLCLHCTLIEKESYPDLLMVKSSDINGSFNEGADTMEITISQIRTVQNFLSYKPYYGPDSIGDLPIESRIRDEVGTRLRRDSFKAVIIDNAERMNSEAQSCFLKTLEEPKGRTIIILVSSKPETLLPTILSRCQMIKFFPVPNTQIKNYLKNQGISEKEAGNLSDISEGRPGRAVHFLLHPEILKKEQKTLRDLLTVMNDDLAAKFQYAKRTDFGESNVSKSLEILQRYFRSLLLMKIGITLKTPGGESKNFTLEQIKKNIKLIENIHFQISLTNANQRLALEIVLMEM